MKLDWPIDFARTMWVNGNAMLLVANGPGPKLAARAVEVTRERQKLDGLVSTGFCGALDPDLQVADIFVATGIVSGGYEETLARPLSSANGQAHVGKLLSVNHVAWTAAEKSALRKTGAGAIEMEAAAVAGKASEYNLPFYCVRVVSDVAGEDMPFDFNEMRDDDGRFSRGKILASAFLRPWKFGDLMKLDNNCKKAAEALGDFIANARF